MLSGTEKREINADVDPQPSLGVDEDTGTLGAFTLCPGAGGIEAGRRASISMVTCAFTLGRDAVFSAVFDVALRQLPMDEFQLCSNS